jgi:hypothetical protein
LFYYVVWCWINFYYVICCFKTKNVYVVAKILFILSLYMQIIVKPIMPGIVTIHQKCNAPNLITPRINSASEYNCYVFIFAPC